MPKINTKTENSDNGSNKKAVVAVILRQEKLLVIRRSHLVIAPRAICFPGGGIEPGETEAEAISRELQEELAVNSFPQKRVWYCQTPWNTDVAWWHVELPEEEVIVPNLAEVEQVYWMSRDEMLNADGLLESNRQFLEAWNAEELTWS